MSETYQYCFKEKKLVTVSKVNHDSNAKVVKIDKIVSEDGKVNVLTKTASIYEKFDNFFNEIPAKLRSLNVSQEKFNVVVGILIDIFTESSELCAKLSDASTTLAELNTVHKTATQYVLNKIMSIDSDYKLKNEIKTHPMYVKPDELAIGLKWKKPKMNEKTQIPSHSMTQTTFQFVSPIKTLKACFANKDFKKCYFEYNLKNKHRCIDNVYEDFCCGSVCRSNDIFQDPLTLKIQLATDDFEVCCALKSKSNIHKVCATYMQIRNMPIEFRSKLDNVFLVALCESSNLKTSNISYECIQQPIKNELMILENEGLVVDDKIIKGGLINIAGDNLGLNGIFGYAECFVASYSCRHCECSREECQTQTVEMEQKMRTRENYEKNVEIAGKLQKVDLKKTKGIKKVGCFNNLKSFHVIDNVSVDLMHDFNEGVMNYALHDFFDLLVENRILTLGQIQSRVRDFCYSSVHKYNTPSLISFDKSHLRNQSTTKTYCLMIHMTVSNDKFEVFVLCFWYW